jgi:hypothetical protein
MVMDLQEGVVGRVVDTTTQEEGGGMASPQVPYGLALEVLLLASNAEIVVTMLVTARMPEHKLRLHKHKNISNTLFILETLQFCPHITDLFSDLSCKQAIEV